MESIEVTYRAAHRNQTTNWSFEGTLEEIAACLCASGRAEIVEITQDMIEAQSTGWDFEEPGLYYTPDSDSWGYERAGAIGSDSLNSLGRTPFEEAVYSILSHDMAEARLERL